MLTLGGRWAPWMIMRQQECCGYRMGLSSCKRQTPELNQCSKEQLSILPYSDMRRDPELASNTSNMCLLQQQQSWGTGWSTELSPQKDQSQHYIHDFSNINSSSMIAKPSHLQAYGVFLFVCLFETGSYYSALTGLDGTCRPGWPQTQKLAFFCLLLSAGVKGVPACPIKPWVLFCWRRLWGPTWTSGHCQGRLKSGYYQSQLGGLVWAQLSRCFLRFCCFSPSGFIKDKISLCYPTGPKRSPTLISSQVAGAAECLLLAHLHFLVFIFGMYFFFF